MDLARLVDALAGAAAYPTPADDVQVIHTHISVVFLAGDYAYKLKKPLDLEFLDFTTIKKRRRFCHEEVRLNRRLAPEVYLGVLPVLDRNGQIQIGADPDEEETPPLRHVVDYVVWMKRLPPERTLLELVLRNDLNPQVFERLARKLADFHHNAQSAAHISEQGGWRVVAKNCRENFEQTEPYVGRTLTRRVMERLRTLTEDELVRLQPLMEDRARRHVPCDTHGDLHLDHVYWFENESPPADLVIVDCIEFNERFRYADPVADVAFLNMDLHFRARPDLAEVLTQAYFQTADDQEGRRLLDFYSAYRAVVRGKVESFLLDEPEVSAERKQSAERDARAHFLLGLSFLEPVEWRPALLLVGGLPGSGKSTLARGLAEAAGFNRVATDIVRKELAGLKQNESGRADFEAGLYTEEWTDRTYNECLRRAEALLLEGRRVVVEASFRSEDRRQQFAQLQRRLGVPFLFLKTTAADAEIRRRLSERKGDVSDADWEIYQEMARRWEPEGEDLRDSSRTIDTTGSPEETREAAMEVLRRVGLASSAERAIS